MQYDQLKVAADARDQREKAQAVLRHIDQKQQYSVAKSEHALGATQNYPGWITIVQLTGAELASVMVARVVAADSKLRSLGVDLPEVAKS